LLSIPNSFHTRVVLSWCEEALRQHKAVERRLHEAKEQLESAVAVVAEACLARDNANSELKRALGQHGKAKEQLQNASGELQSAEDHLKQVKLVPASREAEVDKQVKVASLEQQMTKRTREKQVTAKQLEVAETLLAEAERAAAKAEAGAATAEGERTNANDAVGKAQSGLSAAKEQGDITSKQRALAAAKQKVKDEHKRKTEGVWVKGGVIVAILALVASALWWWEKEHYNSPKQQAQRAVNAEFNPKFDPISPHFEKFKPKGHEDTERALQAALCGSELVVVDGLSGIGKSFMLQHMLQGQAGVIFVAFKKAQEGQLLQAFAAGFGLASFDPIAIEKALFDFKEKHGRPALVVLDDVHRPLKDGQSGIVSFCLAQADDGLLSLLVMGSEEVRPAIDKAEVTGRSRFDAAYNVILQPIGEDKIRQGLRPTLETQWGRSPSNLEVASLYSQVGSRMRDLKRVVDVGSCDLALEVCGTIVEEQRKSISQALEGEKQRQRAGLLVALLATPDGVLEGGKIKPEWDVQGLVGLNLVRFQRGGSPSQNTVQFHHTAVQAAARVLASDPSSPLNKEKGARMVLASEAHKLQHDVTVKALKAIGI
jgi:hypothetical protein